jgi:hypothetical protein
MLRYLRLAVGLVLIVSLTGRDARAQWGYGGWGYGGWGAQTPGGAALQGAGQYAMGAGMYNLDTAKARSINTDTAIRWNQYVFESTMEAAQRHAARTNAAIAKNQSLYNQLQQQLRDNPDRRQIENGDALNAAVSDLSDPRLGSSALRAATAPVPASLIAEVPFVNAAERVTIMLEGIRQSIKWPEVFEDQRFANDQKTFDDLRAKIRGEVSQSGEISARTLREARSFMDGLRAKVEAQPLKDPNDQKDAMSFITSCTSLLDLMEKPDIGPALVELKKVTDTTIGNLLGFMHVYNLRFGPATTPKQRQVYNQLYGILDQTRDAVLAEAKLDNTATAHASPSAASDFLQNVNQGRSRKRGTPRPPQPQGSQ